MTDFDLSGLQKVKAKKPVPRKAPWAPLDLADLHPGTYISADPSLDAFGLVMFTVAEDRRVVINGAQKFSVPTPPDEAKWHALFLRTQTMEARLTAYIHNWFTSENWPYEVCAVHEMPPTGGGKLYSPEVALFASYTFLNAVRGLRLLSSVPRQSHVTLWIEDGKEKKKSVYHEVMKRDYLPCFVNSDMITNEAHRDALSVGLFAARRRR